MREQVLHFIWKHRLFNTKALYSLDGQSIRIIDVGTHNVEPLGPDFINAHIRINDTDWHGSVEIHLNENDWTIHGHNQNGKYQNVILHVVLYRSVPRVNITPCPIATLELDGKIDASFLERYDRLSSSSQTVMCTSFHTQLDRDKWVWFRSHLLTNRLLRKSKVISSQYERLHRDWEYTFMVQLAMKLGGKVNGFAFAQAIVEIGKPTLVQLRRRTEIEVEAVLLGVLGELTEHCKGYAKELYTHWLHLKSLYRLTQQPITIAYGGTRPQNNLFLRLSQLASFICKYTFQIPTDFHDHLETYSQLLDEVVAAQYWKNHVRLDKTTNMKLSLSWSATFKRYLVINQFIPYRLAFSQTAMGESDLDSAIETMTELQAERNRKTKALSHLMYSEHSADSQALIECYDQYCQQQRCIHCALGKDILSER